MSARLENQPGSPRALPATDRKQAGEKEISGKKGPPPHPHLLSARSAVPLRSRRAGIWIECRQILLR